MIHELFKKYDLGEIDGEIVPVSGGLMHKMWKVRSATGTYAVKCLNPEVMKRPEAMANFKAAEELENVLEAHGLPIVPAIPFEGRKMLDLDGQYCYIFRWQEGSITDWNRITAAQCRMAGEILGRMNGIEPCNTEPAAPESSDIDFDGLEKEAEGLGSSIAPVLRVNIELLKKAQAKLNAARANLPSMSAVDNPDMDPKNIMWYEDRPYVIDLECLTRGNPIESCLNLSLQWAGTVTGSYQKENLKAFFEGYLSAYDNAFRSYDELFGIAYAWLEWLTYNIGRALGKEGSDPSEIRLGEEEVRNTIARIQYLNRIEEDVCEILRSLPAPDRTKFKTHDNRICYVDLVFEGPLSGIPEYKLPEGYRFVSYKQGDKDAWIDIELSAEEVLNREHGEECWNRYYGGCDDELPERMFFIETESGEKVATATAFYDIRGARKPGEGQLHWVAVKKEYQGRGLSKPLITYVLGVMKRLGDDRVRIHTQTNTWLACKVYDDLGFRPSKESLEKNRFGWMITEQLLFGGNERHFL